LRRNILCGMRLDLTKRSDYAIRAMLALTMAEDGLLSSRKIAEEMRIPPRFLPQIMGDLTRAGLVDAHPGRSGGYKLAQPADSVTLLRVIEAIEGDPHRQICVMRGTACGVDGECGVHDVFYAAEGALIEKLGSATLQGIIDSYLAKQKMAGKPEAAGQLV
jgi:Rrf2 family protein